jgi:hypothetical protein
MLGISGAWSGVGVTVNRSRGFVHGCPESRAAAPKHRGATAWTGAAQQHNSSSAASAADSRPLLIAT